MIVKTGLPPVFLSWPVRSLSSLFITPARKLAALLTHPALQGG